MREAQYKKYCERAEKYTCRQPCDHKPGRQERHMFHHVHDVAIFTFVTQIYMLNVITNIDYYVASVFAVNGRQIMIAICKEGISIFKHKSYKILKSGVLSCDNGYSILLFNLKKMINLFKQAN